MELLFPIAATPSGGPTACRLQIYHLCMRQQQVVEVTAGRSRRKRPESVDVESATC